MKYINSTRKTQRGFFDLGLAIALLASSGVAIHVFSPDEQTGEQARQQNQSVAAADSKTGNSKPANDRIENTH